MNKIILMTSVAILFLGVANESRADCPSGKKVCGTECLEQDDLCNCAQNNNGDLVCDVIRTSCGQNCKWEISNGTLIIDSINKDTNGNMYNRIGGMQGMMGNYDLYIQTTMPWDEYRDSITAVEINGISNVGQQAFDGFENLKSVTLGESVKTIGSDAFIGAGMESIDLSNVETLEDYAFEGAYHLEHAVMPNNISVGEGAFFGTSISDCGNGGSCGTCDGFLKSGTGCVSDCGAGYAAKDGKCVKQANCTNGASIGGECFPKRYTPAEIAELVGESNTILLYYK